MKWNRLILLIYSLLLFSCFGNEFERHQITGHYYLTSTDEYHKDVYVDFKLDNGDFVGVLPATIFSVGYNKKYIFTKQHPFDYSLAVDSTRTDYYIIPIYDSTLSPEKGVLGPLTLTEFELKRVELGIPAVKFNDQISR